MLIMKTLFNYCDLKTQRAAAGVAGAHAQFKMFGCKRVRRKFSRQGFFVWFFLPSHVYFGYKNAKDKLVITKVNTSLTPLLKDNNLLAKLASHVCRALHTTHRLSSETGSEFFSMCIFFPSADTASELGQMHNN